jgi:predicted membrane protein
MDFIQWLLTGIFIYLAIGYIFICLTSAHENRFWAELSVILFWPILVIIFCICCIYFGWKEMYKKLRKLKYD